MGTMPFNSENPNLIASQTGTKKLCCSVQTSKIILLKLLDTTESSLTCKHLYQFELYCSARAKIDHCSLQVLSGRYISKDSLKNGFS